MRYIKLVSQCQKDILRQYFNKYFIELSKMDYDIKFDKNGTPIYKWFDNYFSDYGRYAFFLYIDDCVAGFAMVRILGKDKYEIAEFYVLPEYRCDDNAFWFANQVINLFDGDFELSAKVCNIRAIKFWAKIAKQFDNGNYIDKDGWRQWTIKNALFNIKKYKEKIINANLKKDKNILENAEKIQKNFNKKRRKNIRG